MVRGRHKNQHEYAMYKGDKFIDLGTLDELSKKYDKTRKCLLHLAEPSKHKLSNGDMTLLYRIED